MRQDHARHGQNRGQRGRNKNRNQNFAQRTLDSNGPDVKVRGTATHICKKYQTLARDAQSAGDRIRAENYLQHADHYYRIVMVAQAQQAQSQPQQPEQGQQGQPPQSQPQSAQREQPSPPPPPFPSEESGDINGYANGATDRGSDENH